MAYITEEERSIGTLFSDLSYGMQRLFRNEVELAKAEFSQIMSRMVKDVAFLAIGAAVGYAAFLALIGALILIIGTAVPLWASALIIGAVTAGVASFLIRKGIDDLRKGTFTPQQTIDRLKEETRWMKKQL